MAKNDDRSKQENCEHKSTAKEVIMGQKTGDRICLDCGAVLFPGWQNTPSDEQK